MTSEHSIRDGEMIFLLRISGVPSTGLGGVSSYFCCVSHKMMDSINFIVLPFCLTTTRYDYASFVSPISRFRTWEASHFDLLPNPNHENKALTVFITVQVSISCLIASTTCLTFNRCCATDESAVTLLVLLHTPNHDGSRGRIRENGVDLGRVSGPRLGHGMG